MAADPSEPDSSQVTTAAAGGGPNPCCAKLWKKHQKSEEGRKALREAVALLQRENEILQKKNLEHEKECQQQRLRGDSAEAAREIESDARDMLEKEIIELKAKNTALQQSQNARKNDNELLRISELEEENRRTKQVLEEERKRGNSEKKRAEEEKSKALEMQKVLKMETQKSEEYKRLADKEKKAANDLTASCEKLKREANETRALLNARIQKTEEALKKAEAEKQNAAKEKKRADSEKSLAEKNRNLIEVERKKVTEEKSRADCLFAKLEEQKKLNEGLRVSMEVERKNTMDEKKHADHLSQKLEEERKRSEYFQRKSDDFCAARDTISFGKHGNQQVNIVSQGANMKLLKEKLKLKKEQLKHAKNVSKLDKAKNALVRRELQLLRQDWMQLLSRFNMLDDHLATGGVEGIHVLTELNRRPEMHNFEQNMLPHNPVASPYFGVQAGIVPFSSSTPREYTSYQLPRESCTRPISGTSELEPPVGNSLRTKSKSHHRSSCPTSISDKKFMGSQDKDMLLVSSSKDIRKKQSSAVPALPPKDNNDSGKQVDRAVPVVSDDSCQHKALKPYLSGATEVTDKMLRGDRKRKRTKVPVESTACLSSKHDLLQSKMKAHDAINGISAFSDDHLCLQPGNNIVPHVSKDDLQNNRRKCLVVADKIPSFSDPANVPSRGAGNACAPGKLASLLSFDGMIRGDCLKLLNLDNDADEEKYRRAIERPLSPGLPIILPRTTKAPIHVESHNLADGILNDIEDERDCPASGANAIDLEIKSSLLGIKEPAIQKLSQNSNELEQSFNRIECCENVKQLSANDKPNSAVNKSCNTTLDDKSLSCLLHEDEPPNIAGSLAEVADTTSRPVLSGISCSGHPNSILRLQHLCKDTSNKNSSHQTHVSSSDSGKQNFVDKTKMDEPVILNSDSIIGLQHGTKKPAMFFVGIMRMKRNDIIRIIQYWDTLIAEARKVPDEAFVDGYLIERISTEPLLVTEDKVALIVSLLLWDLCRFTADPVIDGQFASSAFSLTAKSYMEARWAFMKNNQLDALVSLVEDFLVKREVVECDKMRHMISDASKCHHLDDEIGIQVSTKPATVDQFISACTLLAFLCVRLERVDVILEVSYQVLLMGKSNISWTLLALHVFGCVCGDTFLFPKSCNFLVTTIRLVVLLLECTDTSLCLVSSNIQSVRPAAFPSCAHCPFDVDTVSIDGFISSLLDELELCSLLRNSRSNSNEIIASYSPHLGSSGLEINCGEPCHIYEQAKLAADSRDYIAGKDLCYFTEIISLLELFGSYMSCEWTYSNVVVRLLKILESCAWEEYSAALLVLVSQLGRFFIDDAGYEQRAVSELRNKLSVLIKTILTKPRSIPVQLAAIGALLSLLPMTFDKIVGTQTGQVPDLFVLQARQISEWFVQLSKEHQSLARSFL